LNSPGDVKKFYAQENFDKDEPVMIIDNVPAIACSGKRVFERGWLHGKTLSGKIPDAQRKKKYVNYTLKPSLSTPFRGISVNFYVKSP
jgi:hypothetical protein